VGKKINDQELKNHSTLHILGNDYAVPIYSFWQTMSGSDFSSVIARHVIYMLNKTQKMP